MNARSRSLALVLVLAILGVAGVLLYRRLASAPAATGLTLYGTVDIREVLPAFDAAGRVATMRAREGDRVTRGEVIATLDATRYTARLDQAQAQLRARQQGLDRLLAGSRPEEIAAARAEMDALAASYANDQAVYDRYAGLARTHAVSIQQRDNAKAALAVAEQQYRAAQARYRLAVLGPRAQDIAIARADTDAARAALALARRDLADTSLKAPADGIVEVRILEPGDMAGPGIPVYQIALPSPLWVRAYVPEPDLGKIAPGLAATITTDSFPGHLYHGWIGYISPTAEFTPKSVETPDLRTALVYQLRVFVCDADNQLRLGMPATVHIDLAAASKDMAPHPGCGPRDDGGK